MALNLMTELSKYVTADIILDRILPYMVRKNSGFFNNLFNFLHAPCFLMLLKNSFRNTTVLDPDQDWV